MKNINSKRRANNYTTDIAIHHIFQFTDRYLTRSTLICTCVIVVVGSFIQKFNFIHYLMSYQKLIKNQEQNQNE